MQADDDGDYDDDYYFYWKDYHAIDGVPLQCIELIRFVNEFC